MTDISKNNGDLPGWEVSVVLLVLIGVNPPPHSG